MSSPSSACIRGYDARVASELEIYRACTDVHNLPPIFHYWSNTHIRPRMEKHGFSNASGMFLLALEDQCSKNRDVPVRFVSVGSGNCEVEVSLAAGLRAKGYENFVIECLDLNHAMLERGAHQAEQQGVAKNLEFVEADFNRWVAQREYHAIIADQSLHHVMELEWLFGQIREALRPDGVFVISDIIGRNGHLRWPAALEIVHEFWRKLPPSYRFNAQFRRYEALFEDVDCSTESFEGIRAQDILPLLLEYFHFEFFFGFANVIDPFVDRSFGPHFDPASDWDRAFIDEVHRRDEEEMAAGRLPPTHMLAVLRRQPGITPIFGSFPPPRPYVPPTADLSCPPSPLAGYEWKSWPHSGNAQLRIVCQMLEDTGNRLKSVEKELNSAIAAKRQVEGEFEERTAWALKLNEQVTGIREWGLGLERELAERTEWALQLDSELCRAQNALRDLRASIHPPVSGLRRWLGGFLPRRRNAG